jgi:hypothetical protein
VIAAAAVSGARSGRFSLRIRGIADRTSSCDSCPQSAVIRPTFYTDVCQWDSQLMAVDPPTWMSAVEHCAAAYAGPPRRGDPGPAQAPKRPQPSVAGGAVIRPSFYSEQPCAALGGVARPAGTTVGQGHLLRVGDDDLVRRRRICPVGRAPGASGCLALGSTNGKAAYSRPIGLPAGAVNQPRRICGRSDPLARLGGALVYCRACPLTGIVRLRALTNDWDDLLTTRGNPTV